MEPITSITTVAIAEFAFKKFLETSAGELAKKFSETAIQKMDELRQVIWLKLGGNPKAENEMRAIESGEKKELDRLTVYLKDVIEDDPEFASQLQVLAQKINAGKLQDNSSTTQINKDNSKGWITTVEGGTAYIGDITINQSS